MTREPQESARTLPTLHRSISRAFGRVVLIFALLGAVLAVGLFFASRTPTLLVRMNYDSVSYARHMEAALDALCVPGLDPAHTAQEQRERFTTMLEQARSNITERDEKSVVERITAAWTRFENSPEADRMAAESALRKELDALVNVNEQGMFRRLGENSLLRNALVLGEILLFLTATVWAFLQSDAIAARIAHPLRRAAEVFKTGPSLQRKLRLPDPQTLEVRILFDELARLWERLGELEATNVDDLRDEKNKLAAILESAEDAVLVLGGTGVVAHASERLLDLLGLPRDAVEGRAWTDLSTVSAPYLILRDALRSDLEGEREVELPSSSHVAGAEPSGSEASGADSAVYAARRRELPGGRGQVFLLSNVTEKKRRTVLRSAMMDWISHELKTPVQSLGLASDLLARRDDLDEDMRVLVDTVRQDVARLRTVAAQFMEIARMSPQALHLKPEPLNLASCAAEWLKPFFLTARETGVRLELDAATDLPLVNVDRERFAWVLSNLVSNSLRASRHGGRVWVRVLSPSAGHVSLVVEDDGPGIAPALASTMFEPFSHGRAAGSKEGLAGLGLAVARSIVDAHGASIRYTPRPGGGSLFEVMI